MNQTNGNTKCEQCTYLQGMAVDYSQTSSSDTNQLSLLSGMDMPAKSSESAQQMDGFQACECGKGTLDCSIHPNTPEAWTSFMRDSLAKTLASLESRQAYLMEPDQVFTEKSCASLAWYDQSNSFWKTFQQSLVTGWEPYSETWPRWGMTVAGSAFAHPMSERRITETDGFYWPTPNAAPLSSNLNLQCSGDGRTKPNKLGWAVAMWPTPRANAAMAATMTPQSSWDNKRFPNLETIVGQRMWPTPTAHNAKETNAKSEMNRNTPTLAAQVGGKLNPQWVEWLMGFPIGFTDSKDWVTPKSRSKRLQPTVCLEASK